jgi:hypothetical protein
MLRRIILASAIALALMGRRAYSQATPDTQESNCRFCTTTTDPLGNQGHSYGESCYGIMANCVNCSAFLSCWFGGDGTACPEPDCLHGPNGPLAAMKQLRDASASGSELRLIQVAAKFRKSVRLLGTGYAVVDCQGNVLATIAIRHRRSHAAISVSAL